MKFSSVQLRPVLPLPPGRSQLGLARHPAGDMSQPMTPLGLQSPDSKNSRHARWGYGVVHGFVMA
jgi:hypothetical protein